MNTSGVGDDYLGGGAGDDQLNGGTGGDVFDGGAGFDTARYDGASPAVVVFMADTWANAGEGAGDNFISIEALVGSNFNDTLAGDGAAYKELYGLDGNDNLYGYAGADFVNGGNGADVLDGGSGIDTYQGGSGNDTFVFREGEANGDTVLDFAGNGGSADDSISLIGYGTAAQGASVAQLNATQWSINAADGLTCPRIFGPDVSGRR